MVEKKETKRKLWERGKAIPIIDVKTRSLEEKEARVNEMIKTLPQEEKKEKEKNKWGRPKVMTANTLQKIKLCFAVGMTDTQACYFCWISERALYDYQKKSPKFMQEKDVLKESITMQARVNVWRSIKSWSVTDSWRWLEKKDLSFIPKLQVWAEITTQMSEEDRKMYDKILQNNLLSWANKKQQKT